MAKGLQVVQVSGATDSEASQSLQQQLAALHRYQRFQVQRSNTRALGGRVYKTVEVTYYYPSR